MQTLTQYAANIQCVFVLIVVYILALYLGLSQQHVNLRFDLNNRNRYAFKKGRALEYLRVG